MYCPNCEKLNDAQAKYCTNCLTDLKTGKIKHCPVCGFENSLQATYCQECDTYIGAIVNERSIHYVAPPHDESEDEFEYAGFWRRFIARIMDEIILYCVRAIAIMPIILIAIALDFVDYQSEDVVLFLQCSCMLLIIITSWLYFTLMEISSFQGTIGKIALSIVVADLNGNKIGFGRATARYFGKIISCILYIGYIAAGFTRRKQGFHDMLAGCLVIVKRKHYSPIVQPREV